MKTLQKDYFNSVLVTIYLVKIWGEIYSLKMNLEVYFNKFNWYSYKQVKNVAFFYFNLFCSHDILCHKLLNHLIRICSIRFRVTETRWKGSIEMNWISFLYIFCNICRYHGNPVFHKLFHHFIDNFGIVFGNIIIFKRIIYKYKPIYWGL